MSARDYLIHHEGFDWPTLLADWHWLLPRHLTVWLMNKYGDLLIVLDDGSVWMLDVGGGSFKKTAQSREDFCEKIDEDDNANDWLMIPLVDQLVKAGITLGPGECYSYRQAPILGGD